MPIVRMDKENAASIAQLNHQVGVFYAFASHKYGLAMCCMGAGRISEHQYFVTRGRVGNQASFGRGATGKVCNLDSLITQELGTRTLAQVELENARTALSTAAQDKAQLEAALQGAQQVFAYISYPSPAALGVSPSFSQTHDYNPNPHMRDFASETTLESGLGNACKNCDELAARRYVAAEGNGFVEARFAVELAAAKERTQVRRGAESAATRATVSETYSAYQADKCAMSQTVALLEAERSRLQAVVDAKDAQNGRATAMEAEVLAHVSDLEAALLDARKDAGTLASTVADLETQRGALQHTVRGLQAELASVQAVLELQGCGQAATNAQLEHESCERDTAHSQPTALQKAHAETNLEVSNTRAQVEQLQHLVASQENERNSLQLECSRLARLLAAERTTGDQCAAKIESLREQLRHKVTAEGSLQDTIQAERSELAAAKLASRRAESDAKLLRRQLLELEPCHSQLLNAQRELTEGHKCIQLAQEKAQSASLARDRIESELAAQTSKFEEANQSLQTAYEERDIFVASTRALERQVEGMQQKTYADQATIEANATRVRALDSDLTAMRELVLSLQCENEAISVERRKCEHDLSETRERLEKALQDAAQEKERASSEVERREDLQACLSDKSARLAASEAATATACKQVGQAQQNLVTLRGECAKLRQEGACLQGSLEEATAEASERQREITQFRALINRMDAGWNEMSKQLEAAMLTRHELHTREEGYEAASAEADRLMTERMATIAQLRQVLSQVDRERDTLLAEVDAKAEDLKAQRSKLESSLQKTAEAEHAQRETVERLASQAQRVTVAETDAETARARQECAVAAAERMRSEALAHETELAATADDLRKVIRENQLLNEELQRFGAESDRLQHKLAQAVSRTAYFEHLSIAKETEKEELIRSHRKVGEELSAVKVMLHAAGLERERAVAQSAALEEDLSAMRGHLSQLQSEQSQLLLDAQALERQNQGLTQRAAALDAALVHEGTERQSAQSECVALKSALCSSERSREAMQRSMAQERQGKRLLTTQVDEIEHERQALFSELELERERNSQLEAVATSLRLHSQSESILLMEAQQEQLLVQSDQHALQRHSAESQVEARQLTGVRDERIAEVGAT